MKPLALILAVFISAFSFSQNELNNQLDSIESNIKLNSMNGFEKLEVDIDYDDDLDFIYYYQCAEPKCIEVYLNINQNLEKVISEFCYDYNLYSNKLEKYLVVKQNHCCGESPYTSIRSFNFELDALLLKDNYVIFNSSYELLSPESFLSVPYKVKVINDNYNVRFSPNIRRYSEDESMFSCESETNIIGKIKNGSNLKVLSELIDKDRTWLFVEIESEHMNSTLCNIPIDYEFKNQKLRGWISNKFVEYAKN